MIPRFMLPHNLQTMLLNWSIKPAEAFKQVQGTLEFEPKGLDFYFQGNIHAVAAVMGIEVPDRLGHGVIGFHPGWQLYFTWDSFEGRAVDTLRVKADYNVPAAIAFLEALDNCADIKYARDLILTIT